MSRNLGRLEEFHRLRSIVTDECVVWPYGLTWGYGRVRYLGKYHLTHRLALVLATGGDRPKMDAAHGPCHNRACMNVAHLRWATPAENTADRIRDSTDMRGEDHPNARLSESDVRTILASDQTVSAISRRFGVSRRLVANIKNGRAWRHVWDELHRAAS